MANGTVDSNKAVASGATGAAATVLMWGLGYVGLHIPPEVAAAVTTLLGTGAVYLVPHKSNGGPPS